MNKPHAKRMAALAGTLAALLIAGVAFAAWVAEGEGDGFAQATSAEDLTTVDASASTTAQLYPGATGDLVLRIANTNDYPIAVTAVTNDDDRSIATRSGDAACDASTGVAFDDQSGLSLEVGANDARTFTLADAVSMSNASDTACQGETFVIPVELDGASNAG